MANNKTKKPTQSGRFFLRLKILITNDVFKNKIQTFYIRKLKIGNIRQKQLEKKYFKNVNILIYITCKKEYI